MYMTDSEPEDETFHLVKRALYVEPLVQPIDFSRFPADGTEFIHRTRLESELEDKLQSSEVLSEPKQKQGLKEWGRTQAKDFSSLAAKLALKKEELKRNFPQTISVPVHNEKKCCTFCLGSEMYLEIYKSKDPCEIVQNENLPFLSIVLHLSQPDIFTLLQYHHKWFQRIGMNDTICRWVYVLLACLRKPVGDDCLEFLEKFYHDCVARRKKGCESEKYQLCIISSILENYFCILLLKIGPSLERFAMM